MYPHQADSLTLLALQLGPVNDGKSAVLAQRALDELSPGSTQAGALTACTKHTLRFLATCAMM